MVLAVVDDLLFQSKIRAAAAATGASVVFVRTADSAIEVLNAHGAVLAIVDLDRVALDPVGLIGRLRAAAGPGALRIVGFGSHVHADRLVQAREAGCDRAMARSAFVNELPGLLQSTVERP